MKAAASDQRDVLHALAHLYLQHGQNERALVLAQLADRVPSRDQSIKRTLAYAYVANGDGDAAMRVIDELEAGAASTGAGPVPALLLLRSRALLLQGRTDDARRFFREFLIRRRRSAA